MPDHRICNYLGLPLLTLSVPSSTAKSTLSYIANSIIINDKYWFIILIVSSTNIIVAPSNPSIMPSISLEIYNSPLKFQRDCKCIL